MVMKFVIFTDLDGTLLDYDYSFEPAKRIIERLKRLEIPIIFCSAKTRAEQEFFRRKMGIDDPFIVEDGSCIYVPPRYFGKRIWNERNGYEAEVLGVEYEEIVRRIEKLKKTYHILSYYFMSPEDVAKVTGLSLELAKLAKEREFSETIVKADEEALDELRRDFNVVVGGKFVHVYGKNADKGKAVRILTSLFEERFGEVVTLGIGNSYTDEPMLREVDIPALVRNPDGWADLGVKAYKADGVATLGWVEVVERFVLRGMGE